MLISIDDKSMIQTMIKVEEWKTGFLRKINHTVDSISKELFPGQHTTWKMSPNGVCITAKEYKDGEVPVEVNPEKIKFVTWEDLEGYYRTA